MLVFIVPLESKELSSVKKLTKRDSAYLLGVVVLVNGVTLILTLNVDNPICIQKMADDSTNE